MEAASHLRVWKYVPYSLAHGYIKVAVNPLRMWMIVAMVQAVFYDSPQQLTVRVPSFSLHYALCCFDAGLT